MSVRDTILQWPAFRSELANVSQVRRGDGTGPCTTIRGVIESKNGCTSLSSPDCRIERVCAGLDYFFVENSGFFEGGVSWFARIVFHLDGQILEPLGEPLRLGKILGKQGKPTRVDGASNKVGILRAAVVRDGYRHTRANGHSWNVFFRDTFEDFYLADPRTRDRPRGHLSAAEKKACVRDSEKQQRKNEEDPSQRIHAQEGRSFEKDGAGRSTRHTTSESPAPRDGTLLPCENVELVYSRN